MTLNRRVKKKKEIWTLVLAKKINLTWFRNSICALHVIMSYHHAMSHMPLCHIRSHHHAMYVMLCTSSTCMLSTSSTYSPVLSFQCHKYFPRSIILFSWFSVIATPNPHHHWINLPWCRNLSNQSMLKVFEIPIFSNKSTMRHNHTEGR